MDKVADPLAAFDFDLPEDRIALRPVQPQDAARLLVVSSDGRLEDHTVRDLPSLLNAGDVLVFNDTRVLPAALKGTRPARDALGQDIQVDVNLVTRESDAQWRALARPGKRLKVGDRLVFAAGFQADLIQKHAAGEIVLRFNRAGPDLEAALEAQGAMPLPPYIARRRAADAEDRNAYQTAFASQDAQSVAAPTAGLHFTPRLLSELSRADLAQQYVRLHVGLGTFAPLTREQIDSKRLHAEWRAISEDTARTLNQARQAGQRCIAVGTTALRTLESSVTEEGAIAAASGPTDIFIKPGDPIRAIDGMITNFHLPQSSLFMLVCALMGTDLMQAAYAHAVRERYRFYSYGDACLLLP